MAIRLRQDSPFSRDNDGCVDFDPHGGNNLIRGNCSLARLVGSLCSGLLRVLLRVYLRFIFIWVYLG